MSVIQIPFNGFKPFKIPNVSLELSQALFDDHTEPVGMIAVIQALCLLRPTDSAVDLWNQRWNASTARWKLKNTGIEFVTGKNTVTAEISETASGEIA